MKTDIQIANEKITPSGRTLEILKKYFPQCFLKPETDENGNIIKEHFDTEKLAALLDDNVDITKEGFTLNFLGKSYARYQANLESETVIVPDAENSKTESKNIYIVGDNLDALQHLRYSYSEKIKCIYIDPPYNTGKDDFVYNDKFGFTAKELVEKLDIDEDEAERIVEMQGKCTHSAWLTFMYPRLALARDLLRDDGVIFISIDDNEQANLKRLCDEVFGEGNFVANIAWKRKKEISNDSGNIAIQGEYILIYAKSQNTILNLEPLSKEYIKQSYNEPNEEFSEDKWRPVPLTVSKGLKGGGYKYEISTPKGIKHNRIWAYPKDSYEKLIKSKRVYFGKNLDAIPQRVMYLKESKGQPTSNYWDNVATNKEGKKEIIDIFSDNYFDTPKPTKLIEKILKLSTSHRVDFANKESKSQNENSLEISNLCDNKDSDIILDFFSGSATTAHAVMQLNAQDGGSRKFIMVQLDEKVKKDSEAEKAGYKTIDEIGRERIRRAASKIKSENPDTKADLGFKTYYLKSMPQNTLDKIKIFNPKELFSSNGDIVKSLGKETLLQTWQIKDGFGFDCIQQKIDIKGCTAYLLENEEIGKYLYLLTQMSENSIKELIRRIEAKELSPTKVFVYGYSFDFDSLTALTKNLEMLKNRDKIDAIIRY